MLPVEGVFVAVGLEQGTGFLGRNMTLDEMGYIITNELMETEKPGILAGGMFAITRQDRR